MRLFAKQYNDEQRCPCCGRDVQELFCVAASKEKAEVFFNKGDAFCGTCMSEIIVEDFELILIVR